MLKLFYQKIWTYDTWTATLKNCEKVLFVGNKNCLILKRPLKSGTTFSCMCLKRAGLLFGPALFRHIQLQVVPLFKGPHDQTVALLFSGPYS
jgi:hypothetical protein